MKNVFASLIAAVILLFGAQLQAQTYNLNSNGFGGCANPGIDATYNCAFDGGAALAVGTFTDVNTAGSVLTSLDITFYAACAGNVNFFLNGTLLVSSSTPAGLTCSCQSIASDPLIPQNYSITVTPAIASAFVAGGSNTLSVQVPSSAAGAICFYGADVTLTAGPATVPTLGEWGLIIFGLLILCIGGIAVWKRREALMPKAA